MRLLCLLGLLLRAVYGSTYVGDPSLALVLMRGVLKAIFLPARVKSKFRISGNLLLPRAAVCLPRRPAAEAVPSCKTRVQPPVTASSTILRRRPPGFTPLALRVLPGIVECNEVPKAAALEKALLAAR